MTSLCFASVGVASVWAMLGQPHLVFRSSVVLGITALTAAILSYFADQGDFEFFWYRVAVMVVEAICLLGSLYVVRRNGFRLVRIHRVSKAQRGEES